MEFVKKTALKKLEITESEGVTLPEDCIFTGQSRWLLEIPFDMGVEEYFVAASRPTMVTRNQNYGGSNLHMVRRVDDIYIEFRHFNPQNQQPLMEWFRCHSEGTVMGRNGYGGSYKKDMNLNRLDPTGDVLEKYVLHGCMIKEVRFHDMDNSNDILLGVQMGVDHFQVLF